MASRLNIVMTSQPVKDATSLLWRCGLCAVRVDELGYIDIYLEFNWEWR